MLGATKVTAATPSTAAAKPTTRGAMALVCVEDRMNVPAGAWAKTVELDPMKTEGVVSFFYTCSLLVELHYVLDVDY